MSKVIRISKTAADKLAAHFKGPGDSWDSAVKKLLDKTTKNKGESRNA